MEWTLAAWFGVRKTVFRPPEVLADEGSAGDPDKRLFCSEGPARHVLQLPGSEDWHRETQRLEFPYGEQGFVGQ